MNSKLSIVGFTVLAWSSSARAQDTSVTTYDAPPVEEEPGAYSYAWSEPGLMSGIGIGVQAGGGIAGFTDSGMRDVVQGPVGGLWGLRASFGTHIPLGVDVSYVGMAASLETLTGADNGTLIGTAFDASLRYNILPHFAWNPYVLAGIGWQRYDVRDMNFATADTGMNDSDNALAFPLGAGLAYRDRSGLVIDVHGTFRPTTNSDLLIEPDGDEAQLHTWDASAAIGYEF